MEEDPMVATVIPRSLAAAVLAALMALGVALALPDAASACGCGKTDHVRGMEIHYYEGHRKIGPGTYARWWEVNLGSAGFNYVLCSCPPGATCFR
jgi:hypothetical protein